MSSCRFSGSGRQRERGRALLSTQHPSVPGPQRRAVPWPQTAPSAGQLAAITRGNDPRGLPRGCPVLWFSGCPSETHRWSTGQEEVVGEVDGEKVNGAGASPSTHANKYYGEGARALKCILGFVWFPFCCQRKSPQSHCT